MKNRFFLIAAVILSAACSSPVETYIQNDFPKVVRTDGLKGEIKAAIDSLSSSLKQKAIDANPDPNGHL